MDSPSPEPNKANLRRLALARREALSPEERAEGARRMADNARALLDEIGPAVMAAYIAIRSEADPAPLVALARELGIEVALPAVEGQCLSFHRWRAGDPLFPGRFGLAEPSADAPRRTPDAILVPLVGFDRTCHRLGYGLGYYDRTIAALRAAGRSPKLIGLAFSVQEVAALPAERHDIALDWIVTELDVIAAGD